jgi:SAM-dependent methyltransferase
VTAAKQKQPLRSAGTRTSRVALPRMTKKEGFTLHPFDREHGVQTSGLIPGRYLKTGHTHDRHSTAYFGVAPSVFQALLKRWLRTNPSAPIGQFTFIDVGAGMGRALLLAAEHPFRKVIGIELNPTLADIARHNLTTWHATRKVRAPLRVVCGDALDVGHPKGSCLVFLFNPFGPSVMRRILQRWARIFEKRPGELDLLYVNPEQEHVIERQRGFERLFTGKVRRSRADAIADHKIMANQPDGEYASANYEDCSIWRWTGKS